MNSASDSGSFSTSYCQEKISVKYSPTQSLVFVPDPHPFSHGQRDDLAHDQSTEVDEVQLQLLLLLGVDILLFEWEGLQHRAGRVERPDGATEEYLGSEKNKSCLNCSNRLSHVKNVLQYSTRAAEDVPSKFTGEHSLLL